MKDFLTKNKKLNISSLARYIDGVTRASLSRRKKNNEKEFQCLYLGAFCKINNLTKEDIAKLLILQKQIKEIKEERTNNEK